MDKNDLEALRRYGADMADKQGLKESDIDRLVYEYRHCQPTSMPSTFSKESL